MLWEMFFVKCSFAVAVKVHLHKHDKKSSRSFEYFFHILVKIYICF